MKGIEISDLRSVATTQLVKNLNAERLYGYLGSAYLRYQHNPALEESIYDIIKTNDSGVAGITSSQLSNIKGFPTRNGGTLYWAPITGNYKSLLYVAMGNNTIEQYYGFYNFISRTVTWKKAEGSSVTPT